MCPLVLCSCDTMYLDLSVWITMCNAIADCRLWHVQRPGPRRLLCHQWGQDTPEMDSTWGDSADTRSTTWNVISHCPFVWLYLYMTSYPHICTWPNIAMWLCVHILLWSPVCAGTHSQEVFDQEWCVELWSCAVWDLEHWEKAVQWDIQPRRESSHACVISGIVASCNRLHRRAL